MQKTGRIVFWFFLILMFSLQLTSQAQGKKYFIITGKTFYSRSCCYAGTCNYL